IERHFFGRIDRTAPRAVEAFSDFSVRDETIELQPVLLRHMSSQKLRTPKGLAWIRKQAPGLTAAMVAPAITQISDIHSTIWTEGVWEILHCDESPTKFILSDHPVVTYNKDLFPGCPECEYPGDASIARIGTHTIFPLDLNRCLVITNLQYVRDP